ncbi:hypothetical protein VTJ04DRAFT_6577 [Mycothermus thermophilus]|uniref:uncharacterized protein n=1 Tax=Humicola insolens TaxID=85995 RepID=UPI003742A0D0
MLIPPFFLLLQAISVLLLLFTTPTSASPTSHHHHPRADHLSQPPTYTPNRTRADAVRQAFRVSWDGYYKHAFPHDSLRPVTNSYADDRNGWGASAIDALSTALVMGEWEVAGQILEYVPRIDFDRTGGDGEEVVSVFETTIRYLGGLLSAYDLLTGPLKTKYRPPSSLVDSLLTQAVRLANNLAIAFDTPSGIPDNHVYLSPPRKAGSTFTSLATAGTLVLEWTRLSDLTNNSLYASLAQRAEEHLLHPKPSFSSSNDDGDGLAEAEPFPGLLGSHIRLSDGLFLDNHGSWGGGADSFYEYLLKTYIYSPSRFSVYKSRWLAAAESSAKHLVSHPASRPDLTFLAGWQGRKLRFASQHLACFHAGNFILGGLVLDKPRLVRLGLDLVEGCHATYAATATGIGPESFAWRDAAEAAADAQTSSSSSNSSSSSSSSEDAPPPSSPPLSNPPPSLSTTTSGGFWILNPTYLLRPEVIESYYHAYRATADPKYQDWAWAAFTAVNRTCRAGSGYSAVRDVNAPGGGGYLDFQESFWFAEVLKYAYLIFAEEEEWQVKGPGMKNGWLFNTEAHPVRVFGGGRG